MFLVSGCQAGLYASFRGAHCYSGHGGVPVDDADVPQYNISLDACEMVCDNTDGCIAVTQKGGGGRRRRPSGTTECYLRSAVNITECDQEESQWSSNWNTFVQVEPPPLTGLVTYHLFESKYTGLDNRDAGDFKGDASFIFGCFSNYSKGNPEASIDHNIIEMDEVNVTGWGTYEQCNAPGAEGHFTCPSNQTDYCCTVHGPHGENIPTNHTSTQLPGLEISPRSLKGGSGGYWYSFPQESRGVTWTNKLIRRIAGKCLADAWRKDAGGCGECGEENDQCVAQCIQKALVPHNDITPLQATWDRVFADPNECPDVPFEGATIVV